MYSSPIVPGHEIIGHVVATGDGVADWKVGDRIGGGWHGGHDGISHSVLRILQGCFIARADLVSTRDLSLLSPGPFPNVRQSEHQRGDQKRRM